MPAIQMRCNKPFASLVLNRRMPNKQDDAPIACGVHAACCNVNQARCTLWFVAHEPRGWSKFLLEIPLVICTLMLMVLVMFELVLCEKIVGDVVRLHRKRERFSRVICFSIAVQCISAQR